MAAPDPVVVPVVEEEPERFGIEASWPQTRLASGAALSALALVLFLPVLLAPSSPVKPGLVLPVLVGVLLARHTFSSRILRARGHVTAVVVLTTLPPAVIAVAVVAAAALVAGVDLAPAVVAASALGTVVVLNGAAVARAVEVRYLMYARRVYLVASEAQLVDVRREVARDRALHLVGCSTFAPGRASHPGLAEAIAAARPTMLVLSAEAARSEPVVAAASAFHAEGGRVRDLDGFYARHFRKVPLSELTPLWFLFDIAEVHRPWLYLAFKRATELSLAALLLIPAAVLLIPAAIAIKLTSPGPVFFRQQRVGRDGVPFAMLKLRTMRVVEAGAAAGWATQHRVRITPVGRVLRRWRLDELPQLINVLLGQLSLVGPRPEQVALAHRLEQSIDFYAARHRVRPGLTGWAQVNYGYGGSDQGTLEKLQFDFFYIRNQSLRLDLLVLSMTLRAILRGDSG